MSKELIYFLIGLVVFGLCYYLLNLFLPWTIKNLPTRRKDILIKYVDGNLHLEFLPAGKSKYNTEKRQSSPWILRIKDEYLFLKNVPAGHVCDIEKTLRKIPVNDVSALKAYIANSKFIGPIKKYL
ncbi:MAG: hypothetical protein ACM3UU_09630 [Ignavibacteriales bacterium]